MESKLTYEELLEENNVLREQLNSQNSYYIINNQLQQLSKIGSWKFDLNSLILTLSPESNFIISNEAKETSNSISNFLKKYAYKDEDSAIVKEQLTNAIKNKKNKTFSGSFVYRVLTSEGEIKSLKAAYCFKSEGLIIGVVIDVTERKKAQDALKQSEFNLRSIFNSMTDIVFEMDYNGTYLYIAPTSPKLKYKVPEKALGKTLYDILPSNVADQLRGLIRKSIDEHKTLSIEYPLFIDNEIIWFEGKASPKTKSSVLFTARDISKQKKAKEDLIQSKQIAEESEVRFRAISEQATEGITLADLDGNYIFVNPAFCKMTGYSEQELLKMKIYDLAGNKEQKIICQELFNISTDFVLIRKDQSEFPIKIVVSDIVIGSENFLLGMINDITEQNKTDKALIAAKEKTEKSEKKFRELFEKSGAANLIIDNGSFIDCNQSTVDMLGFKNKREVINTHPKDISPISQFDGRPSMEKADEMMQTALKNGTHRFEWNHKKNNGKIFPCDVLLTSISSNSSKKLIHAVISDISLRKKAEQDLRFSKEYAEENERKLHTLIGNLQGVVYRCKNDGDWTMEYLSRRVYDLTGYHASEIVNNRRISWDEIIHPDYNQHVWDQVQEAINKRKSFSLEYKIVCADGTEKTVFEQGQGVFENNKLLALEGFITDISDQKKVKQELISAKEKAEENEMQFRAITEQSTEGITVADLEGKYVFANPSFCKMSGYSSEELLKLSVYDMTVKNQSYVSFYDSKQKMEGVPILMNLQKKDGTEYLTEIIGKKVNINHQQFVLGTIRDVSEKIKKEQEILEAKQRAEKSEEQFRAIVDQSPLSIQIFDKTGLTLHANTAWEKLWYAKKEAIINKYNVFNDTYAEELGWIKYLKDAFNGETVFLPDMEYDPKMSGHQGRKRTLKCIAFPILIKEKVEQVILIHQDVTRIKKNELDLVKAKEKAEEGDRLKSAFLANMSHEIRTPMNGIMGFTSLLKEPDLTADEKQEFVEVIERSGFRLLSIINDLIDISKIESGSIETVETVFNLNEQLKYLLTFFTPEVDNNGMELSLDNGQMDISIHTDKEKFLAILTNLIKNAIKYSKEGSINFGFKQMDHTFEFYVKDTGVGISSNHIESIFDRFIQADNHLSSAIEGAGLGLAITKAYVKLLGGDIWVKSVVDKGSQFYFTLPIK